MSALKDLERMVEKQAELIALVQERTELLGKSPGPLRDCVTAHSMAIDKFISLYMLQKEAFQEIGDA